MQFYFIRHAQSENNALWARTRSARGRSEDPALTEIGRQQAQHLATFLAQSDPSAPVDERDSYNRRSFGLTHLYTSLMLRAVATGTAVAQALDLPLVAWEDIHEQGGIFLHDEESGQRRGLAGSDRAYFATHYPHLLLPEPFSAGGWWNHRPYEPYEEVPARARRFLDALLARHGRTDDRVAIISHGGFYHALLSILLNYTTPNSDLDEPRHIWFQINNTAITRIDFVAEAIVVMYLNRVDFLPPELIT
jgi:2,3-bisphosphoglycerate-dependent phosphoglycerate mutase